MLCMKMFIDTNWRRSIGQQPGTKCGCRPANKSRINHLLCVSADLNRVSTVGALEETFWLVFLDALEALGCERNGCLPGRTELSASCPARPRSAPPRRAPPCLDPPLVCPGFGIDNFYISKTSPLSVVFTHLIYNRCSMSLHVNKRLGYICRVCLICFFNMALCFLTYRLNLHFLWFENINTCSRVIF